MGPHPKPWNSTDHTDFESRLVHFGPEFSYSQGYTLKGVLYLSSSSIFLFVVAASLSQCRIYAAPWRSLVRIHLLLPTSHVFLPPHNSPSLPGCSSPIFLSLPVIVPTLLMPSTDRARHNGSPGRFSRPLQTRVCTPEYESLVSTPRKTTGAALQRQG